MMKRLVIVFLICMFLPALSFGGEIKGKIYVGKQPIRAGTKVEITFGAKKYTTNTSATGYYRLLVTETGRCRLKVANKKDLTIWIDSKAKAQVYNLEVIRKKGTFGLRKRG